MDRREFLAQNLRLLALGLLPAGGLLTACERKSTRPHLGVLLATSHCLASDGKGTIFSAYDLDADRLREGSVPLELGHVAIPHPRERNLLFIPESAGPGACVLDLRDLRVQRELRAGDGRWFGGHGVFGPGGRLLYVSEFEPPPSGKGFLVVRDGRDFSLLRAVPTQGRFPHDVALDSASGHLTVANLCAETGPHVKHSGFFVSRFALEGEKFLGRVELVDDPSSINASPAEPGGAGRFAMDEDVRRDARYFISYVGVAHPSYELFMYPPAHHPALALWSISSRRLIKEIDFPEQPVAAAYLQHRKYIAVGLASGRLCFIDVARRELLPRLEPSQRMKVSTHLVAWTPMLSPGAETE